MKDGAPVSFQSRRWRAGETRAPQDRPKRLPERPKRLQYRNKTTRPPKETPKAPPEKTETAKDDLRPQKTIETEKRNDLHLYTLYKQRAGGGEHPWGCNPPPAPRSLSEASAVCRAGPKNACLPS